VLHREVGPNTITPNPDELPPVRGDVTGDFTPERLSTTFTDTAPDANKIRMRPAGTAARAEDTRIPGNAQETHRAGWEQDKAAEREANREFAGEGTRQVENRRWRDFEDNLRRNRIDITASCRSCGPAKDRAA
jgi:hypothetical protein